MEKSKTKDLGKEEKKIHEKLNPSVERVVRRKKILLFKEMLSDINYDDVAVADLLMTGVDLVGKLERIGIWRPEVKEPSCSIKTLWANAKKAQKDVEVVGGPSEYDKGLWDLTKRRGRRRPTRCAARTSRAQSIAQLSRTTIRRQRRTHTPR